MFDCRRVLSVGIPVATAQVARVTSHKGSWGLNQTLSSGNLKYCGWLQNPAPVDRW